jgi:hypothetical protein
MVGHRQQPASGDPLYNSVRDVARRLCIGVPLLLRLIASGVIPTRSFNGRRKIAKLVVGQLLASSYEIWPPERRPHYSVEELRRLSGIRVEEVAAMLGLSRTSAYDAARKGQLPARKLPESDRWIIPADVAAQLEAYDIGNLPPASWARIDLGPPRTEGKSMAIDGEGAARNIDAEEITWDAIGHNE